MTGPHQNSPDQDEEPRVVIRDRRRIDPQTGAVRDPSAAPATEPAHVPAESTETVTDTAEVAALQEQLEERTKDLQRITAEYANYRKRTDRERAAIAEQATGSVLAALLPVLDDLDRAKAHGDLTGAFASVAEQLQTTLTKLGLTTFGEAGDPFDPTWHEAVMHTTSTEVTEPSCVEVLRRGYALGERLLRPAMVAVADPESPPAATEPTDQ